jgi:hypothetical protein
MIRRRSWFLGLVLGCLLAAPAAEAKVLVVPPRAGQLGAGIQGEYGALTKTGGLGTDFGSGGGLAVRLRYRMRYERAIGLSFEKQNFEARHLAAADTAQKTASLLNSSIEFYQLFGTRSNTTRMLSAGFGLTQVTKKLRDGESQLGGEDVGDGAFISLGAGLERFVYQSLGIDLNTHYQLVFQNGSTNHNFQVGLGLIFYASY